jgi:hypothetical protein
VALPTALIALAIMAVLMMAFSVLSATEPAIAGNQLLVAQARALAESGIEHALWALTAGKARPGAAGGLPYPLALAPPPFDGTRPVPVSVDGWPVGAFQVSVRPGAAANERLVEAVGWAPGSAGPGTRSARQRIVATLMDFSVGPLRLPCAVCARGDLKLDGHVTVDARTDTSCGDRHGTWSARTGTGAPGATGTTTLGDGVEVRGAGGQGVNQPGDVAREQDPAVFAALALTPADLNALRAYARSQGTYHRGAMVFDASRRMPNGVIVVDTLSGRSIDPSVTSPADDGSLAIRGGAAADPSGVFHGWIIVSGSIRVEGDFAMRGLLYAANDVAVSGAGAVEIVGQVVSGNVRAPVTAIGDAGGAGRSSITYGCATARDGGGAVPQGFIVKPGSYREIGDP